MFLQPRSWNNFTVSFVLHNLSSVRSALMKDCSLIDPSISQLNEVALPSCSFKLNNVKINFRCSLVAKRLDNILRIMEEGSSWETFDPISTIRKLSIDKVRRATEVKRPQSYKSRNSAEVKWMLNLSVMMTVTMRKKIFLKMRTKKDICFLLIPRKIIKNKFFFCTKWTVLNYVMLH